MLPNGSPATIPEIDTAVVHAVTRDQDLLRNISAQQGRIWNRLIVKRLPKIRKAPKLLVMVDADGAGVQRIVLRTSGALLYLMRCLSFRL
jgi:hypothetical protein